MPLPFRPPVEPMLAKLTNDVPLGDHWIFEPKWDGFRAMVFRDGDDIFIQSRDLKPLQRYFPELLGPLKNSLPERCVLDGEIVIATSGKLDFESLLLRIHPAESRVKMLSETTPASYVAFDMLAIGDEDLRNTPQRERRTRLEAALANCKAPVVLTPATRDRATAVDWFTRFEGAGLDGVVAKAEDLLYSPGKRTMIKVKHARTVDCVVAGFRWFKGFRDQLVGSLLLGLFDTEGSLHHVGICASFKREVREQLARDLQPLREGARESHPWGRFVPPAETLPAEGEGEATPQRRPGGQSRWSRGKDLSWEPLRCERVCEVAFDHMQGKRFRHATHLKRWRPDKAPKDCTYAQLEVTAAIEIGKIFGA